MIPFLVGARRAFLPLLLTLILLVAGSTAAWSQEEPIPDDWAGPAPDAPLRPQAAPNPPTISIQKNSGSSIALLWEHEDQTATTYQVWRSTHPYFDPNLGQGVKIDDYSFPSGLYGLFTEFRYVDDGACGYFEVGTPPQQPQPCKVQSPAVMVLGDVNHNYFWAVRAGNEGGEFDFANRVGEFDFALVKGG